MKPFYILVFLFSFSLGVFAQNEAEIDRCGTDERHAILMHDPEYAAQFAEKQIKVGKYLKEQLGESKSNCTDALYLPIAVHFQDVDIDYGCAVEMALSQIQVLNDDFAGTNSDINKWFQGKSAVWTQINNKKSC